MFIRKKKNKSGTLSIKTRGRYKVIKTIGCAKTEREEELMILLANTEMEKLEGNQPLFVEHDDLVVDNFVNNINLSNINSCFNFHCPIHLKSKIYSKGNRIVFAPQNLRRIHFNFPLDLAIHIFKK